MTLSQMEQLDAAAEGNVEVVVYYQQWYGDGTNHSVNLATISGKLSKWGIGTGWGVGEDNIRKGCFGKIRLNDDVVITPVDTITDALSIKVYVKGVFEEVEPGTKWDVIADMRKGAKRWKYLR